MNPLLERGYKNLVLLVLNCLSFCSIAALISILVPQFIIVGVPLVIGFLLLSAFRFTRIKIENKRRESFDLTLPTSFDTGFLIFNSHKEQCAMFFAIAFALDEFEKERVERTLKILLKILPAGAIFSTEWSSRGQCYATFYIKLNRATVLDQARELVKNIKTSFEAMLGSSNIRLLNEKDLIQHLSLGIPGSIREAVVKDKYHLLMKTDQTKKVVSMVRIEQPKKEDVISVATTINEITEEWRILISVTKEDAQLKISPTIFILYSQEKWKTLSHQSKLLAENSQYVHSNNWIHNIGNTLIRNFHDPNSNPITFEAAAEKILFFFDTYSLLAKSPQLKQRPIIPPPISMNPLKWRKSLVSICRRLGINLEMDVIVSIKSLPIRMDGRIQNILFKILTNQHHKQLEWLNSQITHLIQTKKSIEMVFLISNPTTPSITQKELLGNSNRVLVFNSVIELENFLLQRKNAIPELIQASTKVP